MELEARTIDKFGAVIDMKLEDGKLVVKKTFDRTPWLEQAAAERAATSGMRWGEGKKIGTILPADYGRMIADGSIHDPQKVLQYFKERPWLCSFEKALL